MAKKIEITPDYNTQNGISGQKYRQKYGISGFFSLLNEKKSTLFRLIKPQRKFGILKSKM